MRARLHHVQVKPMTICPWPGSFGLTGGGSTGIAGDLEAAIGDFFRGAEMF